MTNEDEIMKIAERYIKKSKPKVFKISTNEKIPIPEIQKMLDEKKLEANKSDFMKEYEFTGYFDPNSKPSDEVSFKGMEYNTHSDKQKEHFKFEGVHPSY